MRQIVLDTETTGIGAETGHRIIEIGCVEMIERRLTGRHFHVYLNPERPVDEGAFKVHGISDGFLKDKPLFFSVVDEFLQFIHDSELIIHNAPFDVGFLEAELKRLQWKKKLADYCTVLDTLEFARKKHPGQRNSLDALCKRYDVDNANRQLHGALLDAEILARVYLAMTGGQKSLFQSDANTSQSFAPKEPTQHVTLMANTNVIQASSEELEAHQEFVAFLIKKSGVELW